MTRFFPSLHVRAAQQASSQKEDRSLVRSVFFCDSSLGEPPPSPPPPLLYADTSTHSENRRGLDLMKRGKGQFSRRKKWWLDDDGIHIPESFMSSRADFCFGIFFSLKSVVRAANNKHFFVAHEEKQQQIAAAALSPDFFYPTHLTTTDKGHRSWYVLTHTWVETDIGIDFSSAHFFFCEHFFQLDKLQTTFNKGGRLRRRISLARYRSVRVCHIFPLLWEKQE